MRALHRKLLRDLRRMWTQVLSIAMLVAAGVMTVVAMFSTYTSMDDSRRAYYEEYRLADVFARLKSAPQSLVRRIERIPGVAVVQSRIVHDVLAEVSGLDEPVTVRLVSIDVPHRPTLNDIHLRAGRWPERGNEVIASERFARLNEIEVGDTLHALVNGRWRALRVAGLGLSPEYVYETAGLGFGDERLFGVLWMGREALAAAYTMESSFNDLALTLLPGASERAVIRQVDELIRRYGGLGAHARRDLESDVIVSSELNQVRVTGRIVPALFLLIAAFLLNVVLSRLVATEREQIGILKSFGYTNRTIAVHYMAHALAAVLIGVMIGLVGGVWLGREYTELYTNYFRFPELRHAVDWGAVAAASAFSAAAALTGASISVRSAARLEPAEAMRPPAPETFRPLSIERLGLGGILSTSTRMVLRNLERTPVRSALSALGIGFAMAVLVFGVLMVDIINAMGDLQFRRVQREDVALVFRTPVPAFDATGLSSLPGIERAEAYRMAAVRVINGHRERTAVLTGMRADTELRQLVDITGRAHRIPPDGLVLSASLADRIGAAPNDTVRIELLEQGGTARNVIVAAVIDEMVGTAAYMDYDALGRLLREAPAASGVWLSIDASSEAHVLKRLKRTPAVAGAASRAAQLRSFKSQISESLVIISVFIIAFAAMIAIGIVYNSARISLSERGRELATLRVLGFTRREATRLLLGEQALLTALGIPLGSALGIVFSKFLVDAMESELVRLPFVVSDESHVIAGAILVAIAALTGVTIRRRVHRLDLVAVLKTRE